MSRAHDELEDPPPTRKPPLVVPISLIALGATAVVVPFLLLRRRTATSNSRDLTGSPPPPIRRVPSQIPYGISMRQPEIPPPPLRGVESEANGLHVVNLPNRSVRATRNKVDISGPLHALKALGIATCIVGVSAFTGVLGVRWAMGVQTMEEFATRMRAKIRSLTPVLSSRIHRELIPSDSSQANHSPVLFSSPEPHPNSSSEMREGSEWVWADASERLSRAYEEGGLAGWMEVAAHEFELEANSKRMQKESRDGRPVEK